VAIKPHCVVCGFSSDAAGSVEFSDTVRSWRPPTASDGDEILGRNRDFGGASVGSTAVYGLTSYDRELAGTVEVPADWRQWLRSEPHMRVDVRVRRRVILDRSGVR